MRARIQRSRVTHDRWLVSYADFITLLFAFFVVLYAFARADQKRQAEIPRAIDSAFKSLGVLSGGTLHCDSGQANPVPMAMAEQALTPAVVKDDLNRIGRDLEARLPGQVAQHTVLIRMGRDGLVISLREAGFFDSGSATPRPDALDTVRKISASLQGTVYDVRVEGHTDNVPIHTAQFDSNWELSSARANRIGRMLLELGAISPGQLSAAGYAEYHPADTNDTPQGRANNRRVDLVVMPRTTFNFASPEMKKESGRWRRITDER